MASIRAKTVQLTLPRKNQSMSISTADLLDLIMDILHPSWPVYHDLTAEDAVTKAKLTLTVISKGVELASRSDQGRGQVTAFNVLHRMRCFK